MQMETVEVLIKLPKDVYEKIQQIDRIIAGRRNGKTIEFALWNGVKNGTVLPKNHGRLIDASQLLTVTECLEDGTERCYVLYEDIENAPTILEAEVENIVVEDRDCKTCQHWKIRSLLPNLEAHGCEVWECKYEPKEKDDDRDIKDRTIQGL